MSGKKKSTTAAVAIVVVLLATVAVATWAGLRSTRTPAPAAARKPAVPVVVTEPARMLGVSGAPLGEFNRAATTPANVAVYYLTFGRAFPLRTVRFNAAAHALTFLEIEPRGVTLTGITAGRYDGWLRYLRRSIALSGDLVLLSFAPEADGVWYPWGWHHVTPAEFTAAWDHVHQAIGTRSVLWVWQMSPWFQKATENPRRLWPGPAEVDIAGLDGYYYTSGSSFNGVLGRTIHYLRSFTSAPLLISETAVGPHDRHQARDITALFSAVQAWHLLGLIWFDHSQAGPPYSRVLFHQDWRFQDFPAALAAFRAAARSYMTGTP